MIYCMNDTQWLYTRMDLCTLSPHLSPEQPTISTIHSRTSGRQFPQTTRSINLAAVHAGFMTGSDKLQSSSVHRVTGFATSPPATARPRRTFFFLRESAACVIRAGGVRCRHVDWDCSRYHDIF